MALVAAWLILAISVASCREESGDRRPAQQQRPMNTASSVTTSAPTVASTPSSDATTTTVPDGQLTSASRLRLDGIGPVRVGMTTAEASRVSGKQIRVASDSDSGPDPGSCGFARPEGGPDIAFMVVDGKIQRVDIGPESAVATVSGVRTGDAETEVHRVYGEHLRAEPHPYTEGGRYLVYDSPEPSQLGLLLIFETDGARVTSFRAGERAAVEAPEGCA
jgi:hypothetical protein